MCRPRRGKEERQLMTILRYYSFHTDQAHSSLLWVKGFVLESVQKRHLFFLNFSGPFDEINIYHLVSPRLNAHTRFYFTSRVRPLPILVPIETCVKGLKEARATGKKGKFKHTN